MCQMRCMYEMCSVRTPSMDVCAGEYDSLTCCLLHQYGFMMKYACIADQERKVYHTEDVGYTQFIDSEKYMLILMWKFQ